jgi:zinc/manganese transport system substrate-binding protein
MSSRRTGSLLAATSVFTVLALGMAACSSGGQGSTAGGSAQSSTVGGSPQPATAEKIKVVASTDVWGSVLAAVGGDKVDVTSIIHDPSADPHSYESTAEDGLAAQNAKLLLSNGGGYDDFFAKLSDLAPGARKLVAYDIAATGDPNEHVFYSLPSVEKVADQAATQLGELQPASKQSFIDNAAAFKTNIDGPLKKVTQIGVDHPGVKVIATEPVAEYLLASAKATDATPPEFSQAIENETDVPAAALQQVKQLIAGKEVKAMVNNAQTVTPVTQQVVADANAAGVSVVDVTETLPAGVPDYVGWMTKQVDALAGALNS